MDWRGQGSLTAPTQPSLLPNVGNYLRFHEEIVVTANQNTRINVNSSTSLEAGSQTISRLEMNQRQIFKGYNQETIPNANQDTQTLASNTTSLCNMSRGWSYGYVTFYKGN